jgi:biopolymer transport protein ExbD
MPGIISVSGSGQSSKSVNSEIPLIPFIDLLLCCVMFLLVTAVWNQLAQINANQQGGGPTSIALPENRIDLILRVKNNGYILASTAGDRLEIPKVENRYDSESLRDKLKERRRLEPARRDLIVAPEDGVIYVDIIEAMDMVRGEGFTEVTLSDGSML